MTPTPAEPNPSRSVVEVLEDIKQPQTGMLAALQEIVAIVREVLDEMKRGKK